MTNFNGHPSNVVPAIAQLIDLMEAHFPSLSVSSTTDGTHATNSYHYRGEAVDMVSSSSVMYAAAAWVISSGLYRSLLEGIHNPNLSVQNGVQVSPSVWGAVTWSEHTSHLHLATDSLSGVNVGGLPPPGVVTVTGTVPASIDLSPITDAIINTAWTSAMFPGASKAAARAHDGYARSHDTWYRFRGLSVFTKNGGR